MTPPRRVGPGETQVHADILALLHLAFAGMEGRIDPPSSLHQLGVDGVARHATLGEVWAIGTPPIACIFLTPKPDRLYLGKLAVAPTAQKSGHARQLIALAEMRARAMGLPMLELETRIELLENHAAFAQMGFVETAKTAHAGYSQPTGITMQKAL